MAQKVQKKILVVDDEEEILQLLDKRLSMEGFQVITASRGKEAIEKTRLFFPDLILMDIVLPDIDGAEVVKMLQDDAQLGNIPIIFLSGIVKEQDEVEGTQMYGVNVDGHRYNAVPKPFVFEELVYEIREQLDL